MLNETLNQAPDQAEVLRNMARREPRRAAPYAARPVRLWAVTGPSGAGVTQVAAMLAIGLAKQAARVAVIDLDLTAGAQGARRESLRLADLGCGSMGDFGALDVLLAGRGLHEALRPGPAGVLVAPATGASTSTAGILPGDNARRRLLHEIRSLGEFAELAIVDAGAYGERARPWLEAADEAICVCTPEDRSITDAYAALKQLSLGGGAPPLHLAVNRAESFDLGLGVWRRMQATASRFLGIDVAWLGALPMVERFALDADGKLSAAEAIAVEAMSLRVLGRPHAEIRGKDVWNRASLAGAIH